MEQLKSTVAICIIATVLLWRRVWDSNPRDVAVKQFSRKLGFVTDSPY